MSNFDPRSPSYLPPGATVKFDGSAYEATEGNQLATTLLASSTISASTAIAAIDNRGCKGALFILDITAVPGSGSATVALKLQTTTPRTATFAARAALSGTGAAVFMVYPGVDATATRANSPLPRQFNALLSVSAGATSKDVTLSLTMMRIE